MPSFSKPLHLARKFDAADHGRAIIWLWDADTNTGRIDAGPIIYVDAPSGLVAEVISPTEIHLTATNNSPVATDFFVYKFNGVSQWLQIGSVAIADLPYSDTGATPGENSYRVVASFAEEISGNYILSVYSNTASATI